MHELIFLNSLFNIVVIIFTSVLNHLGYGIKELGWTNEI